MVPCDDQRDKWCDECFDPARRLVTDMSGVEGFMYPNEIELQWSVLIVLYPFLTGLVAGAFILASLERVFQVQAVKPTYRLALLTALSFLLVAPLPLQLHLGHPERSYEMYLTPHKTSAMAMFGFVYLWYLMAVLVLEIWLDYRRDIVVLSESTSGWKRWLYRLMTLGSSNISERALAVDERVGWTVTLIGIPSAFLLHGYVGFIFGSIKANPWWSSPLMPVVFIFSAMVSGIAAVMLLYMLMTWSRGETIDMRCVDTIASYLFYIFIIDFSLEMLDLIHRIYEADESFRSLDFMVHTKLYMSHIVVQIVLGTVTPIALLALTQVLKLGEMTRKRIYALAGCLTLIGIFAMRWNVVIGGQLFSKSFLGYTTYKMEPGHARRAAGGHCADRFATRHLVGTGEAPASLAGRNFGVAPGSHTRGLNFGHWVSRTGFRVRRSTVSVCQPQSGGDYGRSSRGFSAAFRTTGAPGEPSLRPGTVLQSRQLPPLPGNRAGERNACRGRDRPSARWRSVSGRGQSHARDCRSLPAASRGRIGVIAAVGGRSACPCLCGNVVAMGGSGSGKHPFASAAYAVTSALILAPMLWELTLRFKILPALATAGVLIAFVAGASALAWKRNLAPVVWIANITAAFTALALMIAAHDLAPFISALLIMALASEFAADRNRWLRLRFLVAPAADLAVWILIYIDSLPENVRLDYAPVQIAALLTLPSVLFLIYGASVTFRTTWLRQRITIFEIAQTVIAFLLAAFSWFWFEPADRAGFGDFLLVLLGRLLPGSVCPLRPLAGAT